MYFTEGRLRTYERMMQQKPKYDREPVKPVREEDCAQCQHFDKHSGKCSKGKCIIPND